MNDLTGSLEESVIGYCSLLGADPLLVQGAGGNVSWKEGETLWVKASGTWLAEAAGREIFVAVDLAHLRGAIQSGDFSALPRVPAASALRPSIETMLHAVMPHRVVMHLHPVEVVACLVRDRCREELDLLLDRSIAWDMVDYHKPGAALAEAVSAACARNPRCDVLFLKNHGVVIGGDGVAEVAALIERVISSLAPRTAPHASKERPHSGAKPEPIVAAGGRSYAPVDDMEIQRLAFPPLFHRLKRHWALYPDQVVFLGAAPLCYDAPELLQEDCCKGGDPELAFVKGYGVFSRPGLTAAQKVQLRCYFEVLVRQPEDALLTALHEEQVAELLDWDAERYRQQVARA